MGRAVVRTGGGGGGGGGSGVGSSLGGGGGGQGMEGKWVVNVKRSCASFWIVDEFLLSGLKRWSGEGEGVLRGGGGERCWGGVEEERFVEVMEGLRRGPLRWVEMPGRGRGGRVRGERLGLVGEEWGVQRMR